MQTQFAQIHHVWEGRNHEITHTAADLIRKLGNLAKHTAKPSSSLTVALLHAAANMLDTRIRNRLTQKVKDGKITTFNDMFAEVVQLNEDYVGKQSVSPVPDRNKPPGRFAAPLKTIHCASHNEVQSSEETVHLADSAEQYSPEQTMQYDYEQGSIPLHQTFYDEAGGYRPSQSANNQQRGQKSRPLWNPRQGQSHSQPSPNQSRAPAQPGYSQIVTRQPPSNQQRQNLPGQVPVQQFSQYPNQSVQPGQYPTQTKPTSPGECYRCGSHELCERLPEPV